MEEGKGEEVVRGCSVSNLMEAKWGCDLHLSQPPAYIEAAAVQSGVADP